MMRAVRAPRERYELKLRTIGAAGESLGREAYEWAREALGLAVNEFYGQTECNYVLGSSAALGVSRAGAIGKPLPGHASRSSTARATSFRPETLGEIAIKRPDPVMFLGYWREPEATAAKFVGDWLMTGDQGIRDEDGFIRFIGRNDDIITSAGYRIGPGEIEDCLARPPGSGARRRGRQARPAPHRDRQGLRRAQAGLRAVRPLAEEIKRHVRARLSAAEYPRELAFVDSLPMTTTGKVIRRALRDAEPGSR